MIQTPFLSRQRTPPFLTPAETPLYHCDSPRPQASLMIKADLARIVYNRHGGISQREAVRIVDLIFDSIKSQLLAGENVKLSGFGTLVVVNRKGRVGRNPQTGDRLYLEPSRYVTFRPSRTSGLEVVRTDDKS